MKEAPGGLLSLLNFIPAVFYSPTSYTGSTIDAGELNGRVRNGNGCDLSAIATGNLIRW